MPLLFAVILVFITSKAFADIYPFDVEIAEACGITEDQFMAVEARNQQMVKIDAPPSRWIEVCRVLRLHDLNPAALIMAEPRLVLFAPRTTTEIGDKLWGLAALGFENPHQFVRKHPRVLVNHLDRYVERRLRLLKNLGFLKPVAMVTQFPGLLDLHADRVIKTKLRQLKELGFVNPLKLVSQKPAILSLSIENNIRPKLQLLADLGFVNPNLLIEKTPPLIAYSIEGNVIPKIRLLAQFGFENPVELIEGFPTLLGYDFTNNTLPTLEHLRDDWGFTTEQLTSYTVLIGSSLSRMRELYDWCVRRGFDPKGLPHSLRAKALRNMKVADMERHMGYLGVKDMNGAEAAAKLGDSVYWTRLFNPKQAKLDCERLLDTSGRRRRGPQRPVSAATP